jgi:hypothetical protein
MAVPLAPSIEIDWELSPGKCKLRQS